MCFVATLVGGGGKFIAGELSLVGDHTVTVCTVVGIAVAFNGVEVFALYIVHQSHMGIVVCKKQIAGGGQFLVAVKTFYIKIPLPGVCLGTAL